MYLSILILPLFGSFISGFIGRKIGVTGAHLITCICLFLASILATIAFYEVGICGSPVSINLGKWINSEYMDISWEFLFDQLTVSMNKKSLDLHELHLNQVWVLNKTWVKIFKLKYKFPSSTCTAVVLWNSQNSMGSSLGYLISPFIRYCTGLPSFHLEVIVGLLLGDANISKWGPKTKTARISFTQSMVNFPYLWFVWLILFPYCQSIPYVTYPRLGEKIFKALVLKTRAYVIFKILYDKFIINGVKIVPIDIYDLLSEVGLAHWIMCDGSRSSNKGLVICTDNFTIFNVVKLMNVLLIKWNIKSSINYYNGKPRIYISRLETLKLRELIKPYMCAHFNYKIK